MVLLCTGLRQAQAERTFEYLRGFAVYPGTGREGLISAQRRLQLFSVEGRGVADAIMAGMSTSAQQSFDVSVQTIDEGRDLPPEGWAEEVVALALKAAEAPEGSGVSVVFAGDDVVRELNREHRGLDETTDVLAFSFTHEGEYYGEPDERVPVDEMPGFTLPPGQMEPLGEVIVSYPQAVRQADAAGRAVREELAALLVHGVLHLLGYDHLEPDDVAVMKGLESRVLADVP